MFLSSTEADEDLFEVYSFFFAGGKKTRVDTGLQELFRVESDEKGFSLGFFSDVSYLSSEKGSSTNDLHFLPSELFTRNVARDTAAVGRRDRGA